MLLAGGVACQAQPPLPGDIPTPSATVAPTPRIGVDLVTRIPPTPAVVQLTPTPLPTASPTPTPTPIVYAIQAGDTLWDVAYLHATTLDQLLALNPNVRPDGLQIGQNIILPPPATPVWQAGDSAPIPPSVEVVSLRLYRSPVGSGWILGEVINRGEQPVENVSIGLGLQDRLSGASWSATAWVTPGIVPPGGKAPFGALAAELPPLPVTGEETVSLTAFVAGGITVTDLGTRYVDLAVVDDSAELSENRVILQATVENTGAVSAEQVLLVATLYDAEGNVSGLGQVVAPDSLPAGGRQLFRLNLTPPGGQIVSYRLLAQAVRAQE